MNLGRIGIRGHQRTLLETLEASVVVLSGGKDGGTRSPKGLKGTMYKLWMGAIGVVV
jgi:hypothetical protein